MCVIEAKLEVYKYYAKNQRLTGIIIHHDLEDHDEIYKLVWIQKLDRIFREVLVAQKCIPVDLLQTILSNAAAEILSLKSIRHICYGVYVHIRGQSIGTVYDQSYTCFLKSTLRQIRYYLVAKSLEELANEFGIRIWQNILAQIESNAQQLFKITSLNLENKIPPEI